MVCELRKGKKNKADILGKGQHVSTDQSVQSILWRDLGENIQQVIGNIGLAVMRDVSFQDVFVGITEPV